MTTEGKDRDKGLYDKFKVTRSDGRSKKGQKHERCQYFVLDVNHDPHAYAALLAYAASCKDEYPQLAIDVQNLANDNDRSARGGFGGRG